MSTGRWRSTFWRRFYVFYLRSLCFFILEDATWSSGIWVRSCRVHRVQGRRSMAGQKQINDRGRADLWQGWRWGRLYL